MACNGTVRLAGKICGVCSRVHAWIALVQHTRSTTGPNDLILFVLVDKFLPSLRVQAIAHTQQGLGHCFTGANHRLEDRDRYGADDSSEWALICQLHDLALCEVGGLTSSPDRS